jgi:hypothetical protein
MKVIMAWLGDATPVFLFACYPLEHLFFPTEYEIAASENDP